MDGAQRDDAPWPRHAAMERVSDATSEPGPGRDGTTTEEPHMVSDTDLDIIELLRDEHEDLRELFREVLEAEPQARTDPFRTLVARLAAHEAAEEALVHRVTQRDVPEGGEVAAHALEQEASAERALADMEDLDTSSDEFVEALERLQRDVLAHAEYEETHEFPLLEEHLSVTDRRVIAERFRELRASGPTRPHPMTPQQPTVRALLGPVVGVFDRARDTVRDAVGR